MLNRVLKIGTRGSLLAVAQSSLIKDTIEKKTGQRCELVTIKTEGDQKTDVPLWQLDGKNFFTKELDEALLKGDVDFTIHSYKDLGSDRPEGVALGAITERHYAEDILLISKTRASELCEMAKNGRFLTSFSVGTSSPRRTTNLSASLHQVLPALQEATRVECRPLRGNVNTRIEKLVRGDYDAIVLALAGLERLASFPSSRVTLEALLKNLTFFILPHSLFPAAASQGALALEYAVGHPEKEALKKILESVHHLPTADTVSRERKAFQEYGGGCHLAVGIHVSCQQDHYWHMHRGQRDGLVVQECFLEDQQLPAPGSQKVFLGLPLSKKRTGLHFYAYDELIEKKPLKASLPAGKNLLVTSNYCLLALESCGHPLALWAAGNHTLRTLVAKGFWVYGSCDGLGEQQVERYGCSQVVQMMLPARGWAVLTRQNSTTPLGKIIPCYEWEVHPPSAEFGQRMKEVEFCYWTSFDQYEHYLFHFPFLSQAQHSCGLGKTYQRFLQSSQAVLPMPDMLSLKKISQPS